MGVVPPVDDVLVPSGLVEAEQPVVVRSACPTHSSSYRESDLINLFACCVNKREEV